MDQAVAGSIHGRKPATQRAISDDIGSEHARVEYCACSHSPSNLIAFIVHRRS